MRHYDVDAVRAVRAERHGLLDVGGARRAGNEVDGARGLPMLLSQELPRIFHAVARCETLCSTAMWVSGSRLTEAASGIPTAGHERAGLRDRAECAGDAHEIAIARLAASTLTSRPCPVERRSSAQHTAARDKPAASR